MLKHSKQIPSTGKSRLSSWLELTTKKIPKLPTVPTIIQLYRADLSPELFVSMPLMSDFGPGLCCNYASASCTSFYQCVHCVAAKEVGKGSLNHLYKFDTKTLSWRRQHSEGELPPERSFHAMAADGVRFLYIFGGCGKAGRLNDLWSFDTTSGKWEELASSDLVKVFGFLKTSVHLRALPTKHG